MSNTSEKKIKPKIGTYVSRSTYQKVCEENKKLKADIYALVMIDMDSDKDIGKMCDVWQKWYDKFTRDKELSEALHAYAIKYFKEHPERTPPIINQ